MFCFRSVFVNPSINCVIGVLIVMASYLIKLLSIGVALTNLSRYLVIASWVVMSVASPEMSNCGRPALPKICWT